MRLSTLIGAVTAVVVVTALGLVIVANPGFSDSELRLVAVVHNAGNPVLDALALFVNVLFGPVGAVALTAAIGVVVWATRSLRRVVRFGLVLAVPWGIAETLKFIVRRPRPDLDALQHVVLHEPASYSFPSGHTAFAAALVCAIVLVLLPRRGAVVAGAAVVLLTAWSRVELAAHYPTDVLASMVLVPLLALAVRDLVARIGWLADPAVASAPDQRHDGTMTGRTRP